MIPTINMMDMEGTSWMMKMICRLLQALIIAIDHQIQTLAGLKHPMIN